MDFLGAVKLAIKKTNDAKKREEVERNRKERIKNLEEQLAKKEREQARRKRIKILEEQIAKKEREQAKRKRRTIANCHTCRKPTACVQQLCGHLLCNNCNSNHSTSCSYYKHHPETNDIRHNNCTYCHQKALYIITSKDGNKPVCNDHKY